MELMWYLLGGLTVGLFWLVALWSRKKEFKPSPISWLGIVTEIFLILFALSWFVSSIEEGESQAAGMGLLFIGASALIVFALTRKRINREMHSIPVE